MSYFVYIREVETGKVLRFGAYDEIPYIIAKDGTSFVEPTQQNFDSLKETN